MPLDKVVYIPDQDLYPGETYDSYVEMISNCPLLEEKLIYSHLLNERYTPYRVRYLRVLPTLDT